MSRCLGSEEMKINECKHSTAASELSSPDSGSGSDTAACAGLILGLDRRVLGVTLLQLPPARVLSNTSECLLFAV